MRAVVFAYSNVGDRCLRLLHARGVEVALVVTHRDTPGEMLWFERVADTAAELSLPTVLVEDLSSAELAQAVERARPDVIFSFYFRSMIPTALLSLAPGGAFNMHGSLLPHFRGRAPTNWAVLKGATETGATLHEMVAKPDAGFIVDQSAVPILPDDTAEQVFDKVTVAADVADEAAVCDLARAGLDTVAIRVPGHPLGARADPTHAGADLQWLLPRHSGRCVCGPGGRPAPHARQPAGPGA